MLFVSNLAALEATATFPSMYAKGASNTHDSLPISSSSCCLRGQTNYLLHPLNFPSS
jgi:hypothetical protein